MKTPRLTGVQADAEQRSGVEAVADALRSLGHDVIEREIEYPLTLGGTVLPRYLRGVADQVRATPHPERLSRRTHGYRRIGSAIPDALLARAKRAAAEDERALGRVFDGGVDAVLTPVFTRRPPRVGEYDGRPALWTLLASVRWVPFCGPYNHTGQPAASVPAKLDDRRLPGRGATRGAARRRAAAALAGRPARGRARLARAAADHGAMTGLREIAEAVAREAGRQLREAFAGPLVNVTAKSSPTDLVSEADHAAERLIRERLSSARPGDGFLGEEGGDEQGTTGVRWVVDPLDGTINFLFGIPQWAVSIACEDSAGTLAGVIYDPMRDELWSALARRTAAARRA